MDAKSLGRYGEHSAALYLESRGFRILEQNLHIGHAEVDLVAEDEVYLVFVEVKTRRQIPGHAGTYGPPSAAVNTKKQKVLLQAAQTYLQKCQSSKIPRIDVIELYVDPTSETYRILDLRHIENAVQKTGKFSRKYSRFSK